MDNLKNFITVTQTSETNNDVKTDDTRQLETMDNLQNLKESANSVAKNAAVSTSVNYSKSSKTSSESSGQIKPLSLCNDSVNINTSFIPSDQEEKRNNEILKKTKSTEDKLKSDHEEQHNTMTQRNLEIHSCCIPGCIYNADYLNESTNAKPESTAIFTPSSIENMNEWSSALGLHLTMKSRVCKRHFKSEDILSHGILTSGAETSELKSLKYGVVPLKIQKYGKTLRMHGVKNDHEDITMKKIKKNADNSKTFSHFGGLSENENIKMIIDNDPPTSISNSILNFKNESIETLSNITSNSSIENNNSLSCLENILPKMSAKNSLSISLQPSIKQSKQVLITESVKITDAIDGLNHNIKPVEVLSITSQNNSFQTNLLLNFGQTVEKKLTYNDSFSITAEKSNYQNGKIQSTLSTEVTSPSNEIKLNSFDDISQTIFTISSNKVNFSSLQDFDKKIYKESLALLNDSPSTSSGPNISTGDPNKVNFSSLQDFEKKTHKESIALLKDSPSTSFGPSISTGDSNKVNFSSQQDFENNTYKESFALLKDSPSTSSGLRIKEGKLVAHDVPQTSSKKPDVVKFLQMVKFNTFDPFKSIDFPFGLSNNKNERIPQNEVQMGQTDLDSTFDSSQSDDDDFFSINASKAKYNEKRFSIIKPAEGIDSTTKLELTDDVLQSSVNESSFEQPSITGKVKLSFQSEMSNRILDEKISRRRDRDALKHFLKDCENAILPNKLWTYVYSVMMNSAQFFFQKNIKRIYFNNSYVPEIQINGKFYYFQKAIKTKSDVENLLKDVDDLEICFGYYGTCIGYYENNSEGIKECRNCQRMIEDLSFPQGL